MAQPSIAHHSFSMFDFEKSVTLAGTVRDFPWTNPHVFIDLTVPSESGAGIWSIELTSPRAAFPHTPRHQCRIAA